MGLGHLRSDQLSHFKYTGSEKRGDESVYMAGPGSLEVICLEGHQATIRILESGRSPSFRHTDKTRRLIELIMVVGTIQTETCQIGLCWFDSSSC